MFLPDINDLLADASGMAPVQELALVAPMLPGVLPNNKGTAHESELESLKAELKAEKENVVRANENVVAEKEKVDKLTLDLEKCKGKPKTMQKMPRRDPTTEANGGQPAPVHRPKISSETLMTAKRVFRRYDLDDSGTLNSVDEAQQMTMNMLFSMGYVVSPQEVPCNTLPPTSRHPLSRDSNAIL